MEAGSLILGTDNPEILINGDLDSIRGDKALGIRSNFWDAIQDAIYQKTMSSVGGIPPVEAVASGHFSDAQGLDFFLFAPNPN
jgi:hypothetical protein